MKICLIIDSLAAAGAERVVVTLSESFHKKGHEVHIILWDNTIEYKINSNIKIHTLEEKKPQALKKLIYDIENINEKAFDYIYSHLHGKIKIVKQAKLKNIYYVFHIPISKRFEKGNILTQWIQKKKLQHRYKNENLITVSNGIKEDLVQHNFKAKSITTIYNPFDFEYIKNEDNANDSSIPEEEYIVNVARFHPQKRHDILIKAFKISNLSCKLLLIGKGSKEETNKIHKLIKELKLEEKVIVIGFKANPFPFIKNAKLFVLSSDFEGFGMVLVESLLLGTPVVSTNCKSGPSEIMKGNLANYLVPIQDPKALAKKMKEAFHNPPIIDLENIERFKASKIAEQYLKLKKIDE